MTIGGLFVVIVAIIMLGVIIFANYAHEKHPKIMSAQVRRSRWLPFTRGFEDALSVERLLAAGFAKKCAKCQRATRTYYLDSNDLCPDCRSFVWIETFFKRIRLLRRKSKR
jgi:hypothetical protein